MLREQGEAPIDTCLRRRREVYSLEYKVDFQGDKTILRQFREYLVELLTGFDGSSPHQERGSSEVEMDVDALQRRRAAMTEDLYHTLDVYEVAHLNCFPYQRA